MHIAFASFFFFNDTATTEIYTLSLHDALPISGPRPADARDAVGAQAARRPDDRGGRHAPAAAVLLADRKSTRLNSSHANISYAVFCLKKKTITDGYSTRLNSRPGQILHAHFCT